MILQSTTGPTLLADWLDRLGLMSLARATGLAGGIFLVLTCIVLVLETRYGRDTARLRSRAFVNDVIYTAFYRGGFYVVFVWAAVANAFEDHLGFLRLNVLAGLSPFAGLLVYWLAGDFLLYWLHRAQHRFGFLWAFHAVHHAEQELSTLSQSRRHPVEKVLNGLALYLPLAFVMGLSTWTWIPWYITAQALEALQHAQLDWRLGPCYRVVVSPVFHSIHHSAEARHHNRNFGAMFAFWDYLFGTAEREARRPDRFGVDGLMIPESLGSQLLAPLKLLRRRATGTQPRPSAAPADSAY